MMKKELLQALLTRGEEFARQTLAWAKEMSPDREYADLASFFAAHPSLSLPDKLLGAGKGDIFVSLHTEEFNGVPHCHDFVEIIYVCRGSVTDCVEGNRISLSRGDACIHNPSATHFLVDFDGKRDTVLNILLSRRAFGKAVYAAVIRDNKLDGFFNRLLSGGSEPYRAFKELSDSAEIIVELLVKELLQSDGYSAAVMESILLLLFAELLRNYRWHEDGDFAANLESYLVENLQNVTVESAAAAFGYHPKYFSVLVRKETGRTFRALLTEQRMKKAESQLLFTDYSIEEIAESLGYRDAVSLYGNFKSYSGMTPSEFRYKNSRKN